jgi:cold shock CspA family protein
LRGQITATAAEGGPGVFVHFSAITEDGSCGLQDG